MEILVVTTKPMKIKGSKKGYSVKVINGGPANPAEARNIAIKKAKGSIIAFVDDDCQVHPNWISNAVKYFNNPKIAAIGGPSLIPKDASFLSKCSGLIFSSNFGTSAMSARWSDNIKKPKTAIETDLVLSNMFARKNILININGFDGDQVPCEENELCYRIQKKGYKLLYTPDVIVWHRLRPLFLKFARRIFFYATGRGVMSCRYPDTFKTLFIVPSFFALGLILSPIILTSFPFFSFPFFSILFIYLLFNFYNTVSIYKRERDKRLLFIIPIGFFIEHFFYGLGFISSVFFFLTGKWRKKKLKR